MITEKQQLWLDAFFGEAQGDAKKATELAGYAEGTHPSVIIGALQEEIQKRTKDLITASAAKAYFKMDGILDTPGRLGAKELIAASKDLMDRGGLAKTDKVEVGGLSRLFVVPAKERD
jgi:hypothetical protein